MNRLLAIADKELRQVRRDKLTLAMMVVLPVMQLLLFGYAINNDVRHMPTLVLDEDRSAASRDFIRSMEVTGYYDIVGYARSYDELDRAAAIGLEPRRVVRFLRRARGQRARAAGPGARPRRHDLGRSGTQCGAILAQHFPPGARNPDELPNRVVMI